MPDLYHAFQGYDLGYLRIVADLWGFELKSRDSAGATKELVTHLLDSQMVAEIISSLPVEAQNALNALAEAGGRIPWATFVRQYGDVREMGTGKRDREKPQYKPSSTAEILYYRALLGRAFFDTASGAREFAYVPEDLLSLIKPEDREGFKKINDQSGLSPVNSILLGRGATPGERAHILAANSLILDDSTTLLAALRLGHDIQPSPILIGLLNAAKLLKKNIPQGERVKTFLEAPRTEALKMLVEAWRSSETFNELRLIPGLICEGEWKNQPLATREFILNWLHIIPGGKWWNVNSLISDVKKTVPDFQRPAGNYDSWFIRREADGQYLRGFAYWDQVDGTLIRFFIVTILHYLGMVDVAGPEGDQDIAAFRLVDPDAHSSNIENGKLKISSNGRISSSRLVPRAARYQLARFCEWDEDKNDEIQYHITPESLTKAKEQGLKVEHLLVLLSKHAAAGIPPVLVKSLKRWEVNGTEARAEMQIVLRVSRPEVLEELRKSKAARFLGEPLGPTTIVIKAGAQLKVMAAVAELGLLAEDATSRNSPI
jgi:Helicase conserved C-terminal domain